MAPKAPRIAEEIWEQHRNEITALYCAPKGTLKKTMQIMEGKYGFQATKNQYTTKFETWGIQKYADRAIWAYVDQKLRKRKLEEGKDSGFIIHERKRTRLEVEKEIARNVTHMSRLQLLQDIPTPAGVQVFTPGAEASSASVALREVCTSNLPSVQLQREIHAVMCKNRQIYKFDTFPAMDNQMTQMLPNSDMLVQSSSQLNSCNSPLFAARSQQIALRNTLDSVMSSILRDSISKKTISLTLYFPPDDIDNDQMLSSHELEGFGTQFALQKLLQYFISLTNNGIILKSQLQKGVEWISTNLKESFLSDLFGRESTAIRTFMRKILPAAVSCGNTKMVECIIEKNIDILNMTNYRNRDGYTEQEECMSIAVTNGDSRMVELLCTAGFSLQIVSHFSSPNSKMLWDTKNLGALRILLSFGADPECFIIDKPRHYPLIDAAKSGGLEAVKMLVKRGSTVNSYVQAYFGTSLQAAVWAGHLEIAEFLIRCGADINALSALTPDDCVDDCVDDCFCSFHRPMYWGMKTPIQIACAKNHVSLAKLLLTHGANVDLTTSFQIERYFKCSHRRDYRYSIHSPHCNEYQLFSALQYTVQNGNIDLVRLLLSNRANPDSRAFPVWEDTPLQLSIRLGYTEIARILIEHGANVNASPAWYNGRTALQAAAESGNIQLAQMLLRKKADVNAPPGYERGRTALQAAIKKGHLSIAHFLCLSGANINANHASIQGFAAIRAAAEIGDLSLINDLVRQGADIRNAAAGHIAVLASIFHGNLLMLKSFIEHGAPINGNGKGDDIPPIVASAMFGWIDGVSYLLDNGADVNSYYYENKVNDSINSLDWSIINHDVGMVTLLLKRGANIYCPFAKTPYNSSLCLALDNSCSMRIIDKLINESVKRDPFALNLEVLATAVCNERDDDGGTRTGAILNAISNLPKALYMDQVGKAWNKLSECRSYLFGSRNRNAKLAEQVIRLLLQAGADINARHPWIGCTLLQTAVYRVNIDIAKFLIEEGADIQGLTSNSIGTPLQIAIRYNEIDFAYFLLERGADVNAPPAENSIGTALQAAVSNGNKTLVLNLLERGAEVNVPSAGNYGVTALHEAANRGNIGIAIDLLQHGAHVSEPASPKNSRTAIDGAAEHGQEDMLQLLLNHYDGSEDLKVVCDRAATYATEEGHFEIASWLRRYPDSSTE
ncbi:hypothetical protein TMatcc_006939 [Talaromyces marneffei ATCC 18224]|nr:hypothetical protein EYB25_004997 [Talaromyces marneffei]